MTTIKDVKKVHQLEYSQTLIQDLSDIRNHLQIINIANNVADMSQRQTCIVAFAKYVLQKTAQLISIATNAFFV